MMSASKSLLAGAAMALASLSQGYAQDMASPEEVERWTDFFTLCSGVFAASAEIAVRADKVEDKALFVELATRQRDAAAVLKPLEAPRRFEAMVRDDLPDLRVLSTTEPQAFMTGPYRQCSGGVQVAQAVLAAEKRRQSRNLIIE